MNHQINIDEAIAIAVESTMLFRFDYLYSN